MKIDEAIKILEANELVYRLAGDTLGADATKLGIEALKVVALWNEKQLPQHQIHLPGETK